MRGLLGTPKVTYIGYSYGTWLGTWFGATFGQNIDRMILDSALDTTMDTLEGGWDLQPIARDRQFHDAVIPYYTRYVATSLKDPEHSRLLDVFPTTDAEMKQAVLRGGEAVIRASRTLHQRATRFVHTLERGPFYTGREPTVHEGLPQGLGRGVVYRTLYSADLMHHEAIVSIMRECIGAGEVARVYDDVPLRLLIADDECAIVVLPQPTPEGDPLVAHDVDGLLVEEPGFLESLTRLFDSYWTRGVPVPFMDPSAGDDDGPGGEVAAIVSMLSLGMTDATMARALGVSERTVHRRISALMDSVGVHSRFQLGMELTRSGRI